MALSSLDIKQVLIEEIALNGLEGIGLNLLWQYVEKRLEAPVTQKLKQRFWTLIINVSDVIFYKRSKPFVHFQLVDRFTIVDEASGHLAEPDDPFDGPYEYSTIENEHGSCPDYDSRILITKAQLPAIYEDVESKYGDFLTIVGSLEQRWHALAPHLPVELLTQLTPIQYCLLELIGRGRENGQIAVGKTNVTKIVKDPKFYFYNRLPLLKLDLISSASVTQLTGGRSINIQLVFLKRFRKPSIMYLPKVGKIHKLLEHLQQKPGFTDYTDEIVRKKLLSVKNINQLRKRTSVFKLCDEAEGTTIDGVPSKKRKIQTKISIASFSEESSQSEDEKEEIPLTRNYKVGISLLRQAYKLFLDAGLQGLTQTELGQLLGIEFYTSRSLCRFLVGRHLLKQFFEEAGRHKTTRYMAVAVSNDVNKKYEDEINKYRNYVENTVKAEPLVDNAVETTSHSIDLDDLHTQIEEVTVINGCESAVSESFLVTKKKPTLRQLTFANGMIELIREKKCLVGYGYLSTAVAERIKNTPLDIKILKRCLQRLITDKQVKVLKINWPNNPGKFNMLICTPTLHINDPIIQAKYKEICMKEISDRAEKEPNLQTSTVNLNHLNKYSYPRYTKMNRLHSLLVRLVYMESGKHDPHLPPGFCSFTTVLSEMPVDLALGCLRTVSLTELSDLNITDEMLKTKLSNCSTIHNVLFRSGQFKNTVKFLLKLLSLSGLTRMIRDKNVTVSEGLPTLNVPCSVYYVCRNATIINTAGKWPRVADLGKLKSNFTFENDKDVENFWDTVYKISMETHVLGHRNNFKTFISPLMDEIQAVASDTGELQGDGRGPCGFDSGFFLDSRHGWKNFIVRRVKTKLLPRKATKSSTKKVKSNSKPNLKQPKPKQVKSKKYNVFKRAVPKKKTDEPVYDQPVNQDGRVKRTPKVWSKYEDSIIVMCKAAITIMSPQGYPGALTARNAVIKDIVNLIDPKKSIAECHARALAIETDPGKCYEKECILNELRRRTNIIEIYENLFVNLRHKYSRLSGSFFKAVRTRIMELVWTIMQIVKTDAYKKGSPCVAVDYKEFHNKFRIDLKKPANIYHTPNSEPLLATLKEGIIMAVMHTVSVVLTPPIASQIHTTFKSYPEQLLRLAVEDLRKAGVLSSKDRNGKQKDMKSMVKYYYKIAIGYRRKFLNRFTEEFILACADTLIEGLNQENLKGSPAVNCIISELYAVGSLDVVLESPSSVTAPSTTLIREEELNVLDIETKYKLKSGSVNWVPKESNRLLPTYLDKLKFADLRQSLLRYLLWEFPEESTLELPNDDLLIYLKEKGEVGVTFSDLLKTMKYNETSLTKKLRELSAIHAIVRVGFNENIIIHIQHLKSWTIQVNDRLVIPAPWINMALDINYEILFKWLSALVFRVFEGPGISIAALADACEFLNAKNIQNLCQFLQEYECVNLKVVECEEPGLFSDDNTIKLHDFNEFKSTKQIAVFPTVNMMSTYSYISKVLDMGKEETKV